MTTRDRKFVTVAAVCCLFVLGVAVPARAYIDPNAAGLVSQILTPLLIFAAAALTFLRKQIGAVFSALTRRFRSRDDVEQA
jgi:hypothetical protein